MKARPRADLLGLFKGLYDANIFASVLDVVRPERGHAVGFRTVGWLVGAGTARWRSATCAARAGTRSPSHRR